MTSDFWTEDRVAQLRQLWTVQGLSGSIVGSRLGISRSAVIGKVHRLNLPPRHVAVRKPPNYAKAKRKKSKLPVANHASRLERLLGLPKQKPGAFSPYPHERAEILPPQADDIARVSLLDLENHHCKWVCAEQTNLDSLVYCGDQRVEGLAYCPGHAHRAYRPEKPGKGLFRLSALDFDARTNPRFVDNREPAEPA